MGDKLAVSLGSNNVLQATVTVDAPLQQTLATGIENAGSIQSNTVNIQAQLQQQVQQAALRQSVNNTGVIEATGFNNRINIQGHTIEQSNTGSLVANGGNITLDATGNTTLSGIVSTNNATGMGGAIDIGTHNTISLNSATITANGSTGGGRIRIGGEYQGGNTLRTDEVRNAQLVNIDTNSLLQVNTTSTNGNGGQIIVWADNDTTFLGRIMAKGGTQTGNGGLVETSAYQRLFALGTVDASAGNNVGNSGRWLLDPNNITIQGSGTDTAISNVSTATPWLSTNDNAIVTANSIQTALNGGTNVTIQTSTGGSNTQSGNITVAGGTTIQKTTGNSATLTLKAHQDILFDGSSGNEITIGSSGNGNQLNIQLLSDSDGVNGGSQQLNYTTFNTNGGNIYMAGGTDPLNTLTPTDFSDSSATGTITTKEGIAVSNSNLLTQGGTLTAQGWGRNNSPDSYNSGILVAQGSVLDTGTGGTLRLRGHGGSTYQEFGYGIYLNNNNTVLRSNNGLIELLGTGGTALNNAGWHHGVYLGNNSLVEGLGNTPVTITGQGGGSPTTSSGVNVGTYLDNYGTVRVNNGTLTLRGTGGIGYHKYNDGVYFGFNGIAQSLGTGNINLIGQGGGGTISAGNNYGIAMGDANNIVSSMDGDITLEGTGGIATSEGNSHGIWLVNNTKVFSQGNGQVRLTGVGGGSATSTGNNNGIYLTNGAEVSSVNNTVILQGTGGNSSGSNNSGIAINNSTIKTLGTGGISATGIGGGNTTNSTGQNYGITLDNYSSISSTGNTITLNATGGNAVTGNTQGLWLDTNSRIEGSNNSSIDIIASKGNNTPEAIVFNQPSSYVQTHNGNLSLRSTSGDITLNANTTTTGTGNLNIWGRNNIAINRSAQTTGSGIASVVAGWDGNTGVNNGVFSIANLLLPANSASYGNNTSSVYVSNATNTAGVRLGGNGGTNVLGYDVTVQAGNGDSNFATIGADDNGNISTLAKNNINLYASQAGNNNAPAYIGNSPASWSVGSGGNITVEAGNDINLISGNAMNNRTSIGNLNWDDTATQTTTGDIRIKANNLTLQGGSGGWWWDFALIGNGGGWRRGDSTGNITVDVTGNTSLIGGSSPGSFAKIGHGGIGYFSPATLTGTITLNTGNLYLESHNNHNYTQIGHGIELWDYAATQGATNTGDITVNATGNIELTGSGRSGIGHGSPDYNYTSSGNIAVTAGNELKLGTDANTPERIGHWQNPNNSNLSIQAGSLNTGTANLFDINDAYFINSLKDSLAGGSVQLTATQAPLRLQQTWNDTQANPLLFNSTGNLTINQPLLRTAGAIQLKAGGTVLLNAPIQSNTTGNAVIVASTGGNIVNTVSSNGISTPNGRWLLYSGTPNDSTINLTPTQTYFNRTFTGYPPSSLSTTGNLLLYQHSPTLTVMGNNFNRLYGDSNPTLGYTLIGGLLAGHTSTDALTGNVTTTALATSTVGTYSVTQGSLTTTPLGYTLQYTPGTLSIAPKNLTVQANNASKFYGDSNPLFTATFSGLTPFDTPNTLGNPLRFITDATNTSLAGDGYNITPTGLNTPNYNVTYLNGKLTVLPQLAPSLTPPYVLNPVQDHQLSFKETVTQWDNNTAIQRTPLLPITTNININNGNSTTTSLLKTTPSSNNRNNSAI